MTLHFILRHLPEEMTSLRLYYVPDSTLRSFDYITSYNSPNHAEGQYYYPHFTSELTKSKANS